MTMPSRLSDVIALPVRACGFDILDTNNKLVADTISGKWTEQEDYDRALAIARALNSHDAVCEALEDLAELVDDWDALRSDLIRGVTTARAALAKARAVPGEGETP